MADVIQFKIGVTFGDLTQIVIFFCMLGIQNSAKNVLSGLQLKLGGVTVETGSLLTKASVRLINSFQVTVGTSLIPIGLRSSSTSKFP